MRRRCTFFGFFLATAVIASAGIQCRCAEKPVSPAAGPALSTRYRVSFDSIVNVGYKWRRPMHGWAATELVVERTLRQWYSRLEVRPKSRDSTLEDLKVALESLPSSDQTDISIVYLASSQTRQGQWEFTGGGSRVSWADMLGSVNIPSHPRRIVLLDACHASAVMRSGLWSERLAPSSFFASLEGERTYELNFRSPFPLNLPRRFPEANAWLRENMPADWDGKISFFGLIWLQAFLKTAHPPETQDDWKEFLRLCRKESEDFRTTHSRRLSSTINGYVASGAK